ncbi:hypothetical protein A9W97_29560 [Mycobacterium gordonae]|nr:PE family protein [Mycobacterium gordonae]OBJ79806.1 hypothetical protein A9W97_29560 [Mycobacterium gordonae]PJE23229.1 MAG: PE family protein [Mycobacterium sp.]
MLANPELIAQAATDLTAIDTELNAAQSQAAGPIQALLPAAADEVSAGITQLFSQHAADFQKVAAQASAYHEQFVQKMATAAGSYAAAETVNTSWLFSQAWEAIITPLAPQIISLFFSTISWIESLPPPYQGILFELIFVPLILLGLFWFLIFGLAASFTVSLDFA